MTTAVGAPERRIDPPPHPSPAAVRPRRPGAQLCAGMWRWHFYASFLVVPVLAILAATGLVYLFRFQIEPALHPDLMQVGVQQTPTQPRTTTSARWSSRPWTQTGWMGPTSLP